MILHRITVIAVLILLTTGLGATDWFQSAPSGIPGLPVSSGPSSRGWSLSVERSGDKEARALYSDGSLQNTTDFFRSAGRLLAREERDAEGFLVSRVEYAYDSEGNPRAVFIGIDDSSAGSERIAIQQSISADFSGYRSADGSGEDWNIRESDSDRNPTRLVTLESGVESEEVLWNRDSEGRLREEIRTAGTEVTRSRYDLEGRLVEETLQRDGTLIRLRTYQWAGMNLIRTEERGEGRLVVRVIAWSRDRKESETRSVDGIIVSEILWSSSDDRIETLFRDGIAIIRIHWTGSRKIREEFLKDGEVVRVQEGNS